MVYEMADIDLKPLSLSELEELAHDVQKEIERRKKQEIKQVAADIKALVAQSGLTLDEVLSVKTKQKGPAKYRNPENPEQTWAGRGKRPDWLRDALAAGRDLEEFSVE